MRSSWISSWEASVSEVRRAIPLRRFSLSIHTLARLGAYGDASSAQVSDAEPVEAVKVMRNWQFLYSGETGLPGIRL